MRIGSQPPEGSFAMFAMKYVNSSDRMSAPKRMTTTRGQRQIYRAKTQKRSVSSVSVVVTARP